jgi:hypothetical protein
MARHSNGLSLHIWRQQPACDLEAPAVEPPRPSCALQHSDARAFPQPGPFPCLHHFGAVYTGRHLLACNAMTVQVRSLKGVQHRLPPLSFCEKETACLCLPPG